MMSQLSAQEILEVAHIQGVQIKLTDSFSLEVSPASNLQPSQLDMLRSEKQKLVEHLSRQAAKELMLPSKSSKALFNAYHRHHFNCPQCIAAGLGHGRRCVEGKPLWFCYELQSYCDD